MIKTEGIILHVIDYRDYDQILTVLSADQGIQKFFYKGGKSAKRRKGAVASPLVRCEFVYRSKGGDLQNCSDITVLSHALGIRKDLETLEAAFEMISAVKQSQLPGKPSPLLYTLFVKYLEHLPGAQNPRSLASSFYLKLLKHEGHIFSLSACGVCAKQLQEISFCAGESYCKADAPPGSIHIAAEESPFIRQLLDSRSLPVISGLELPDSLRTKIKSMYESMAL